MSCRDHVRPNSWPTRTRRESNARAYPRHLPIAIADAAGSFVRDLDGNVFIDFLNGAGVLTLGHNHPELVHAVIEQLGVFTHGLDFPTPAKDAFTRHSCPCCRRVCATG
ncbi:MAG: aminotransferase class III-fold pyridoxal phosphate-dependent enzyme [Pseudonocardiaceae bacterium]